MPKRPATIEQSEVVQPPQPPSVPRRFRLYPYQWVGIPVLALIVLLALLGTFGDTRSEASARGPRVSVRVEYPSKFRYKQSQPLRVWVTNTSPTPLDTLEVSFDQEYIDRFSNVRFTPSVSQAYRVPLTAVRPGETRLLSVDLQAERYGTHPGRISVTAGGPDTTAVLVSTLVLP
jgi:hypothetical protein